MNLHTLKLQFCGKLKELPIDIQKLVSLKHLDIKFCHNLTHMPYRLGQLTSLQTLSSFVVSKDSIVSFKRCGGLAELNKLNDLRGEIEITNLELVKDAISETKAANLKEKQHLSDLSLKWNSWLDDVINAGDDEKLLDGLEPPQNLKYLLVEGYRGVRFSIWLSSLTNLTELNIHYCNKCRHLSLSYQLPSLRRIFLLKMYGLEYISDLDIINDVSASSLTTFFPSLESLDLQVCPNLKGWWKRDIVDNGDATIMTSTSSSSHQYHQQMSLPSFPCLSDLTIVDCSKLTSMPLFPYLEGSLYLDRASWKALQQTMAMKMNTAGASSLPSSIPPLSKLRRLRLGEMLDKESLPEEWLQNLTSLEELSIWGCSTSLSQILRPLTSLKELRIADCEEVDLFSDADDDGTKFQHVKCLQSLSFINISKLESLPAYLQSVTILQHLEIAKCPSLMTLPEWIGNLTSLQSLTIGDCPNLTSLPEGMRRLTSLQSLWIDECPHLEQRCQKEIGEDWTKIAHVPKMRFG